MQFTNVSYKIFKKLYIICIICTICDGDEISSAKRYTDFSPSLRTQNRARTIRVTTRTRHAEQE